MKYNYSFRIHEPTHSLVLDMEDERLSWVSGVLLDIKSKENKKHVEEALAIVANNIKKEVEWTSEINGLIFTKEFIKWFDPMGIYQETNKIEQIETSEFQQLFEIWWNKYIEVEGEPQV